MDFANLSPPACFLVDNGSRRAESTLTLRRLAGALGTRLGRLVEPVSLLHSSAVSPEKLEGRPAETLEAAVRARYASGIPDFLIIPLFFGPSGALESFIPALMRRLAGELPRLQVFVADPLAAMAGEFDPRVASVLTEHVRSVMVAKQLVRPAVVVVDHGSPRPAVAAVRNQVAREVAVQLGAEARAVFPASMERRPGAKFAFGDPLLEATLRSEQGLVEGNVIAALMFFAPGRHAGPGGDVERICRAAEVEHPGRQVYLTPLFGDHPLLIEILADRYEQLIARDERR